MDVICRSFQAVTALIVGVALLPVAAAEGRFQVEVGPPVVVIDTETGALWVGVSHPPEILVLKRGRYEDEDGALHDLPPEDAPDN